jgi:Mn2+/Fe2+ NRAMP family transporter
MSKGGSSYVDAANIYVGFSTRISYLYQFGFTVCPLNLKKLRGS